MIIRTSADYCWVVVLFREMRGSVAMCRSDGRQERWGEEDPEGGGNIVSGR